MLTVQNITYRHPDKELLFENISASFANRHKTALIGNNGTGKSTLLRIMAGLIEPTSGAVMCEGRRFYIPQHFGQFDTCTIADALGVSGKLHALRAILNGETLAVHFEVLDEDWNIEERCREALDLWQLPGVDLAEPLSRLSGGEKTKVFLAGIRLHRPDIVLMDEPSNHLDVHSRALLYDYIRDTTDTLVVVTHDRLLLRLLSPVCELTSRGLVFYGGGYDLYLAQKSAQEQAAIQEVGNFSTAVRKAEREAREVRERKEKGEVRGRKKLDAGGGPRIARKKRKDTAERSARRLRQEHEAKQDSMQEQLLQARQRLPSHRRLRLDFGDPDLYQGKILLEALDMNHHFGGDLLWSAPLRFTIRSGERISLCGANGSGKSTLLRLLLGDIEPAVGAVQRARMHAVFIDQDYSLIRDERTVYEQVCLYNREALEEHELRIRLYRFLFDESFLDKPCGTLSGGEKLRLSLCCLMIAHQTPDIFVLDEPTNNLDLQSIDILTHAVNEYRGTLLVVSHDSVFLEDVGVERVMDLS
ncbi:MAG: ATP-binding cassette domain-containing protein [Bacteroidia bacterium]|nr:ATP-binding cassette domain-containing protein [Bacteroidia bacterium]